MHKRLIQTLPLIILITLSFVTAPSLAAQTPETSSAPVIQKIQPAPNGDALAICSQRLEKVLSDFDKLEISYQAKAAENQTNLDLRTKEEAHNAELLKAVALLVSSEKRNKSFFDKLRGQLGRVLQSATDPKTIGSIVSVILIVDRLKK